MPDAPLRPWTVIEPDCQMPTPPAPGHVFRYVDVLAVDGDHQSLPGWWNGAAFVRGYWRDKSEGEVWQPYAWRPAAVIDQTTGDVIVSAEEA